MNKQYRAILVATGKEGWNKGDIVKMLPCHPDSTPNDYFKIASTDRYEYEENLLHVWQSKYLVITSDEQIKEGDWYIDFTDNSTSNCFIDAVSDLSKCKKIIATNQEGVSNNITLSDLKYYMEMGCPDMVSLEMVEMLMVTKYDILNAKGDAPLVWLPKLIGGHDVVFAREKTLLEKIDDVSNEQMDEFIEKHGGIDISDTNVGKMDEIDKPIIVERFSDNGEHSHWERIEPKDGAILWTGDDEQQHPKPVEGVMDAEEWLTKNKLEGLSANDILKALTDYAQYILSMSGNQSNDDDVFLLISDCRNQIQYLQEKFQETGSGNAILAKIDNFLTQYKTSKL